MADDAPPRPDVDRRFEGEPDEVVDVPIGRSADPGDPAPRPGVDRPFEGEPDQVVDVPIGRSADPGDPAPRPEVEVLFEGDADQVLDVPILGAAWQPENEAGGPGHIVGTDRLGQVVSVVSDTMEAIREQRREEQMAAGGTSSTMFPERQAQVIQATRVPLADVLALLAQGLTTPGLDLDDTVPTTNDGIAVFPGRLRMKVLPLPRVVELRVYPTASSNLTVLELQPRRKWMPQTRRYLSAGVPRITALTDRIERAAAEGARHRA